MRERSEASQTIKPQKVIHMTRPLNLKSAMVLANMDLMFLLLEAGGHEARKCFMQLREQNEEIEGGNSYEIEKKRERVLRDLSSYSKALVGAKD